MKTQREEDLDAVLRTLKLAQAQLRSLQRDCQNEATKESELADAVIAIELLVKKLRALQP